MNTPVALAIIATDAAATSRDTRQRLIAGTSGV
jgi:hypothetical protein